MGTPVSMLSCASALARDDLPDDGEGDPQLRQPPHEQLVRLGEPEQRTSLAEAEG